MKHVAPRDVLPPARAECQQPRTLRTRPEQIVVVCLDPPHRELIGKGASPGLVALSCPLQVFSLLGENPRQRVILDRCPAELGCCLRVLRPLQRRIHRAAHPRLRLLEAAESFRRSPDENILGASPPCDRVREICQRCVRSGHRARVNELAAAFGVSQKKLNRLFRAAGADSPMRVYRRELLGEAHRLLQTTSRPIEAIAEELGYFDASSFSRAFRSVFGFYPGRLRRRGS